MDRGDHFQQLMDIIERAEMLEQQRRFLLTGLRKFREISLCDIDRRDPDHVIAKQWLDFKKFLVGDGKLLKRFNEMFWDGLETKLRIPVKPKPIIEKPAKKKLTETDFFYSLAHKVDHEMKECPDKNLVLLGLYTMIAQVSAARYNRKQDHIVYSWRIIQPRLRQLGFLDEFDPDKELQDRVKRFIKGEVL